MHRRRRNEALSAVKTEQVPKIIQNDVIEEMPFGEYQETEEFEAVEGLRDQSATFDQYRKFSQPDLAIP